MLSTEKKAPCIGKLDSVEKLAGTKEEQGKKEQVKHGTLLNEEEKKKHDELFDLYIIGA